MVLINESHELLESMLCLESLLFRLSMLLSLFIVDLLFGFEAVLHLILLNFGSNQICLHPANHVHISPLILQLNVVILFHVLQSFLSH